MLKVTQSTIYRGRLYDCSSFYMMDFGRLILFLVSNIQQQKSTSITWITLIVPEELVIVTRVVSCAVGVEIYISTVIFPFTVPVQTTWGRSS